MYRLALVVGGAVTLMLAGCGNQSITITETADGVTGSVVVTSDSTAIAAVEARLGHTATRSIHAGDTHSGAHLCGFSVSKNGHSYQVDFYGIVQGNPCDTAGQQGFLADAP